MTCRSKSTLLNGRAAGQLDLGANRRGANRRGRRGQEGEAESGHAGGVHPTILRRLFVSLASRGGR